MPDIITFKFVYMWLSLYTLAVFYKYMYMSACPKDIYTLCNYQSKWFLSKGNIYALPNEALQHIIMLLLCDMHFMHVIYILCMFEYIYAC